MQEKTFCHICGDWSNNQNHECINSYTTIENGEVVKKIIMPTLEK